MVSIELEEPITTEYGILSQTLKSVGLNIAFGYAEEKKSIRAKVEKLGTNTKSVAANPVYYGWRTRIVHLNVETESGRVVEEPITTEYLAYLVLGQTLKSVGLNIAFGYAEEKKSVRARVGFRGTNTKSVAANPVYYGWRTKNIGLNIPFAYNENLKDIQAKIELLSANTKSITANVIRKGKSLRSIQARIETHGYTQCSVQTRVELRGETTKIVSANVAYMSKSLRNVQTKIWWDSGKTVRTVQARVGKPATIKPVTVKCGFPKTARSVRLKTPIGYKEIWKTVQLKVEKYSEIVTRIVVADTRRTTYGFVTKPVGLNIGKYPYNAKTITTKVEQYGESVKPVSCDIWLAKGQSVKPVSCKVNKSRQIINVGLSIHEYTGESTRPVGLSVQPYGETVKPVGLSVWSDLSETVKPVGLSAVIPGEAHKPVKLSVWSDLSETVKPVGLFVVSYPETYKAVRANVSPTHRWIPVSANVVRSGMNYRAVKANIINEVWAFDWQSINARIEKYAAHTKNIRARRKVQVSIKYYEGYHIRPVSVNVNVPTANTRAVKLKIHMYKVYGTITDEEGKPVKDATVFLYKRGSGEFITAKTTKTNSAGYYEIPEVPYGNYHVIVIKQARTLNFGPITINGAHVDVKKDLPLYKASKDTCLEEIMSPRGDLFRFQVLYDEVFPDKSRIIEILLIWGDLYNQLPTYYRETDGIFKVETPASAKLTVLHDFFETGGKRSEGKDDHFITPTKDVSEFMWRASLYHPNFIGFIVRCNTRGNVYTILSTNIGGYIDKVSASPEEPGVVTPRPYPVRAKTSRPVRCCLPLPGIVGCPNACTREVRCRLPLPGATIRKISCCVNCIKGESVRPIGCDVELPYGTTSRPVLCHLPYRGTNTKSVGCCLPLPGIVGCPNFCSRPVKLCTDYYIAANTKLVKSNVELPIGTNTKSVKCYVRYPVICDLVGRLPGLLYPGYVSYPTVSGFILDESRQPTSGTVDVIDKETGILLYHCDVGDDGWYTFAVPPNRCYILVMCKPGYQCRMLEICIGETPVVDRNVTEFGGPPFECEINCYYYNRAFEFPPLVPLEDYYVYGHVYNSKTLEPLEGVFIVAGDYEGTCVTGPDGFYKIHLPAGTHDLVATKRGFKRAKATVVISSGVEQDLYLDPIIPRRITFTGGLIHKPIYI